MVFAVVCNLPPGVHQYKFIVDGEWRHDENQPYMPDPLGNVNNWIFVGAPGAPPTVASAACATALVQPAQVRRFPLSYPNVPGVNDDVEAEGEPWREVSRTRMRDVCRCARRPRPCVRRRMAMSGRRPAVHVERCAQTDRLGSRSWANRSSARGCAGAVGCHSQRGESYTARGAP
jgi:hypothetical protein